MCVMDDVITDATKEGSSNSAQSPVAHNNHGGFLFAGNFTNYFPWGSPLSLHEHLVMNLQSEEHDPVVKNKRPAHMFPVRKIPTYTVIFVQQRGEGWV